MRSVTKERLIRVVPKVVRTAVKFCLAALKAVETLAVRTHKARWQKVSLDPHPHWDARNCIISDLIPAGSSVLDVGSGAQTLRRHLKPGCKYQPCDVVKSSPDVILCDFNAGVYPDIQGNFDYVVCSGVLEYIRNPNEFLKQTSSYGDSMILSYCPLVPKQGKLHRLSVNWINHFTKAEVERTFEQAGLNWRVLHTMEEDQTIYSLRPKPRIDATVESAAKPFPPSGEVRQTE